jgi:hypothetical protein
MNYQKREIMLQLEINYRAVGKNRGKCVRAFKLLSNNDDDNQQWKIFFILLKLSIEVELSLL